MADHFPSTRVTWIDNQMLLGEEGIAALRCHVMEFYLTPLRIYLSAFNIAGLGEEDDVLNGFFTDKVAKDRDFFSKWKASGKPLRRWLMNALCLHFSDLRRKAGRDRHQLYPVLEQPSPDGTAPETLIDRAFRDALVAAAFRHAADLCAARDLQPHWEIFVEHRCRYRSYREIAAERGLDRVEVAGMNRAATRQFSEALKELLLRDGVRPEHLDKAIEELLSA